LISNPQVLVMMIPGAGRVYSLGCAIAGTDFISGKSLSTGERLL
jgi:hypothetical protein